MTIILLSFYSCKFLLYTMNCDCSVVPMLDKNIFYFNTIITSFTYLVFSYLDRLGFLLRGILKIIGLSNPLDLSVQ